MKQSPPGWRAAPHFAPLLAALTLSLAYWPGLVTWDSLRQYDQALSGDFDDWHPPIMEWVWRQFLPLVHGPAPMLLLQLGLYAAGWGLLISTALRVRLPGRAFALGCCALLPIPVALMATILKDSLMTGALLCAAGLGAWADMAPRRAALAMRLGGLALCLFAAALRMNAFLAVVPLAIWLSPPEWRATRLRLALSLTAICALAVAALPVANRLVGAQSSDVQLSLIIFDLGGITEQSGVGQFPPLGLKDPVAVNHRCYEPVRWDSYSWWVEPLCPIDFEHVREAFERNHRDPKIVLLSAILHHPLAYAAHRLAHWNINARFLVPDEVERPVQVEAPPNIWGIAITPNPAVRFVDAAARASAHTPLGWPCVWMATLVGLLWASRGAKLLPVADALAWSALLYGLGYAALSVASELRYYLWTMVAGAGALVLALPALNERRRLVRLLAPPLAVSLLCIGARIGLI